MDWRDPLMNIICHLPDVPMDLGYGGNSMKDASVGTWDEASSDEGNETSVSNQKMLEIKLNFAENTDSIGSEETRDFARFDELFNGDLPCTLLYLDRNAHRLKAFKTLVDLTQFIETPDVKPRPNDRVIQKLQSAPVGQLVHYSTLEKYMQYLYRGDKFMDVIIDVDGTPFMAHRIVLCCHSSYFRNLLMHDSRPVKIPIQVKVFGVSVEAFAAFIEYLYSGKVYIHPGMINDFIYIAEYLDVKSLCDKLYSITGKMSLAESIKFLLRSRYPSGKHYSVALTKVISQFSEACMIAGFRDLNVDIFCSILKSDALMVTREYQVFQAAVRWIVHGGRNRVPFIPRVMSHIRFCHMTVDELFDCMDETRMFLDYKELSDLILIANWVRTATRWNKTDPFNFQVLPRRKGYANQ
ncbi:kelch-like protein 18, partial [Ruditapes philippinarum]|uniref:kelch-like protein 18 n=1 Tax=Ruditapes philippinarum TaxID=129788 RepID=UPI00295C0BAD